MSATLKFTDYLNNKKKLNVPTTLPVGNEPVMSTGEIGNVTMPKYTDALNGSSFGNTKQQLPAGIQAVQLAEATPNYSDAVKPGMLTPGSEQVGYIVPKPTPDVTVTEPLSFEEYVLSLKSKADDQYKRDILNAQNTYDQSKSAYGTKAASLSNMGLTGSGYSDYLDSRAYGQMQADKNAAIRTRDETKLAADTRFMDYLNQQETNKTNMFNSLYDTVGSRSNADIDNLAAVNGFTPEQVAALKAGRREKVISALDTAIANGSEYSKSDLDRLFDINIPEEKALYDRYYQKIKDEAINFTVDDFKNMDQAEAKDYIDAMKANGIDTTAMDIAYEKAYKLQTNDDVTYKKTVKGTWDIKTPEPGTEGAKVKIYAGDETYTLAYKGGKASEEIVDIAKDMDDLSVFKYDGTLYLKLSQNEIYPLTAAKNKSDSYTAVSNMFDKKKATKEATIDE